MAEPCPICFREVTADPAVLGPNLCTKRVDSQQWRRTECFNVGIQARDERLAESEAQLAASKALNDLARLLLIKTRGQIDLAIAQIPPAFDPTLTSCPECGWSLVCNEDCTTQWCAKDAERPLLDSGPGVFQRQGETDG